MAAPGRLIEYGARIEAELQSYLLHLRDIPSILAQAMTYSACGGGKRFRGGLAMGACEAVGGAPGAALPAACALEMVHAFSLIHDDLPCMDDDDLRRGKPTNHKVFGEAIALLAGDGLLVLGIQAIFLSRIPPERAAAAIGVLLQALGPSGMIGGQVLDMEAEDRRLSLDELRRKDGAKTGALIRAAARIGAIVGGGTKEEEEALDRYAESVGLAFQIIDDILDLTGEEDVIGKRPGSDRKNNKATYPALLGLERARALAEEEIAKALAAVAPFGERGSFLVEMAQYVATREK